MQIPIYQVDAFAEAPFHGNPAAVCPLPYWLDDALLQAIATENQLSETAFLVAGADDGCYELRWFSPVCEVDLCGHATLAAAYVLYEVLDCRATALRFNTRGGELRVTPSDNAWVLDFPAVPAQVCTPPAGLLEALNLNPSATVLSADDDYLVVLASRQAVQAVQADYRALGGLALRGVAVTARGHDEDFVSRFFAPRYGIDEDPVTGSAHCALAPYWAKQLGRTCLRASQLSARGGVLQCEVRGPRVLLSGRAVLYMQGEIRLPD